MAEPAGDVAGAESTPSRDAGEGGRRRGPLRDARVAWAVALVAVLVAGFTTLQWQELASQAAAREEAREAAEVIGARVTTFEGATIDEFVTQVQEIATGDYAEDVTALFNADFRAALREGEVESVGEVLRSFVQRFDGDEAEVFLLLRQTSINAALDQPVEDEIRMEMTLVRDGDRWLASDIAVLGPAAPGAAPPPAPAPDREVGEPDEEAAS